MKTLLALSLSLFHASALLAADTTPLKVLLITGGCCHDYVAQKDILKNGLEARANVVIEHMHTPDTSTKPPLPLYGNPAYAKGYDLVIHDECAAGIDDPKVIAGVLQPHRDGIPAVNLHCAMHCYRFGNFKEPVAAGADNAAWYEYMGLQSSAHGPKEPIAISYSAKDSPVVKGLADWTTGPEELYNNVQILTATALARGKQMAKQKDGTMKESETVVVWTNEYGAKKTRVFSTTIGHFNTTVEDARYLDLVARGVLWATGHLNEDGTPAAGYGPGGK
jgi:hypothetical protein